MKINAKKYVFILVCFSLSHFNYASVCPDLTVPGAPHPNGGGFVAATASVAG